MKIHSEDFGFNRTLSVKGSTCEYHYKYCNDKINEANVKINSQSHFSDESAQNIATIYKQIKFFIHWMYKNVFHKGYYNI